jgi:hypothetical protein
VLRNQLLLWTASIGFELCELSFRVGRGARRSKKRATVKAPRPALTQRAVRPAASLFLRNPARRKACTHAAWYPVPPKHAPHTSQHLLPNFNECWWDSLLLDVAICNFLGARGGGAAAPSPALLLLTLRLLAAAPTPWGGGVGTPCSTSHPLQPAAAYPNPPTHPGITLGMATVHWFDSKYKQYNWQGLSELDSLTAKVGKPGAGRPWDRGACPQRGRCARGTAPVPWPHILTARPPHTLPPGAALHGAVPALLLDPPGLDGVFE